MKQTQIANGFLHRSTTSSTTYSFSSLHAGVHADDHDADDHKVDLAESLRCMEEPFQDFHTDGHDEHGHGVPSHEANHHSSLKTIFDEVLRDFGLVRRRARGHALGSVR